MSVDSYQQQPTAMWNPARGVWEIPVENILCEHWGLFSATFPTSGMMRGGKLFPLPLLAHRTDENEFSLLRTPVASEAEGGAIHPDDAKAGGNTLKLGWQMLALGGHIQPKLPTPTAQAAKHGSTPDVTANSHGSNLWDVTVLFPTPNTMEHREIKTPEQIADLKKRSPGGYRNLRETVVNDLIPTPRAGDRVPTKKEIANNDPKRRLEVSVMSSNWGKFAPAIHQWETITGNPAPPPTIPDGRDGQARLNPQFAEWMMGLPPGWITDCDITRNEQLKACGNGVVPQQATLAITRLIQGVTL
jgi:DNA (cytosine-5)-methyltransferase 1